jgi:DNA modification methylase
MKIDNKIEVYNDDCFKIMRELINNGVVVDAIICDPPYNINIADWDNNFHIKEALELCKKLLKPNGNIVIFQGWSEVTSTIDIMNELFTQMNWIIWDRIKGRGATKNFTSTREDILWYCNGTDPTFHKIYSNIEKKTKGMGSKNGEETRALSNVWYDISPIVPWSEEKTEHPSQKPVELMERCIKIWTNAGDTILDFTMGTGTTGVAARNLNRKFIGIESDSKWFGVACERLADNKDKEFETEVDEISINEDGSMDF